MKLFLLQFIMQNIFILNITTFIKNAPKKLNKNNLVNLIIKKRVTR